MSAHMISLFSRMSQHAVSSPATGGYRGNDRKVNLLERSYE